MKPVIKVCTFGFLCSMALGADFTLPDGTVYKEAKVSSKGIDSISVSHSEGVAKVAYDSLSPAQQEQYGMTPELVSQRKEKLSIDQKQKKEQELSQQKAKQEAEAHLRKTLADAKKQPRYITGQEAQQMFSLLGNINSVEAEVLALSWNLKEATQAGLNSDSEMFKNQLSRYDAALKKIREDRAQVNTYLTQLQKDYDSLKSSTDDALGKLKSQVKNLKTEVNSSNDKTERIIISNPVYVPVTPPCNVPHRPLPPRPQPPRPQPRTTVAPFST